MFFSLNDDEDSVVQKTKIIAKILTYLSPEELRTARLVCFTLNKIIIAHPHLFWGKHSLRVRIRSSNKDEKQLQRDWAQLRLRKLLIDYNCPNFHFVKTDLISPGAVEFFQSSIRHQIKHLVITSCQVTGEILIHIFACIGRKLEHLEVQDFSKFTSTVESEETVLESRSIPYLYFPCLSTLILSGESCSSSSFTGINKASVKLDLPRNFMHIILNGSRRLRKICFLGWTAKTCERFTKLLGSVDPEKLESVEFLEISCTSEKNLEAKQQYGLLKPLGWVYIPFLKKLKISFEDECHILEEFSFENQHLIQTMTNSIATLIEGCAETLESIELLNCPVENNIFRIGINSFPKLRHLNTSGSFVTRLDEDANPIQQSRMLTSRSLQNRPSNRMFELNQAAEMARTISGNLRRLDPEMITRIEVFKIISAVFLIVAAIHATTKWAFGPHIGGNIEVFIFAVIVLVVLKRNELMEMWTAIFSE